MIQKHVRKFTFDQVCSGSESYQTETVMLEKSIEA